MPRLTLLKLSPSGRRFLRRLAVVVIVVVILVGFRLVQEIGPEREPEARFTAVRVLDGDTIELAGGDLVRLLGVDTPERDEPLFDEARMFVERLVLGRQLRLEFGESRRDRYGRLLAFAYADTVFVNRAIIENGLGYLYLFDDSPSDRAELRAMMAAQQIAIRDRAGLLGLDRAQEPYYIASQSSYRFHRPGCRSAASIAPERTRRFATREEALAAGLSPCRNCRP
ncbi:MAG: thermonuclease family protein [candidate division Zixibacteria bacterium]|jgi:endonuclease YncB( thermonuclease family)|nr:thermonuclease family protein [candidate division Zixibacteria bacterium]